MQNWLYLAHSSSASGPARNLGGSPLVGDSESGTPAVGRGWRRSPPVPARTRGTRPGRRCSMPDLASEFVRAVERELRRPELRASHWLSSMWIDRTTSLPVFTPARRPESWRLLAIRAKYSSDSIPCPIAKSYTLLYFLYLSVRCRWGLERPEYR